MNTYSRALVVLGLIVLAVPISALAASISLSPTTVSVQSGDTFTVAVTADPASTKIYSVRANIAFDSSVLQVSNFSFASTWMPVSQPGYDTTDNASGVLIKTGGYPGGITSSTRLGTISFKAIKTGTVTISATGSSLLLDASSANQLSGGQGSVAVSVTAPAPKPTSVSITPTPKPKAVATKPTPTKDSVSTTTATSTEKVESSSLLAAVNGAITFGTGSPIVSALLSAVIVLLLVFGFYYTRKLGD